MRRHGKLLDILLLPAAALVVLLEDVVWAGARATLRALATLGPIRRLAVRLGTLPGWLAIILFLVPELLGRIGEVWAFVLLAGGHGRSAVVMYVSMRVVATMLVVFIYHSCEPALLGIRWFAVAMGWAEHLRDWAKAMLAPVRTQLHSLSAKAPGFLARRFVALRLRFAHRIRRTWR